MRLIRPSRRLLVAVQTLMMAGVVSWHIQRNNKNTKNCLMSNNRARDTENDKIGTDNPTVFGAILRGEEPAVVIQETDKLLMFHDNNPRAAVHALIIPKEYIPNVFSLRENHIELLLSMREMAHKYLSTTQQQDQNCRLVFHVPPFHSVDHLHLHVMSGSMPFFYRAFKYAPVDYRWSIRIDTVIERLQDGKKPTPW